MIDQQQYDQAAREAFSGRTPGPQLESLGAKLLAEFSKAEQDRTETETRWLQDLRQFKGKYDPDVLSALDPERSRVYVRKTRVKVKTANSRVEDLLFPAGSEKNWEVDTTPIPSVPREMRQSILQNLAQMAQGQPVTQEMVEKEVLRMCKEAAKGMAKVIDDQLNETRYKQICKQVLHSGHLYGTGVLKGPLIERRIRSKFIQENGKWVEKTESYVVPFIDYVPVWRLYPDMESTTLDDCQFIYERHQMTRQKLVDLANRKSFRGAIIKEYLQANPFGQVTVKTIDTELKSIGERDSKQGNNNGVYEVLERWGWLSGSELKECGAKVPDDRLEESFFGNVWLLPNGVVIKAVLNPINGVTWPYHFYYFDKDETSIFAEGLATVMRDDQTTINSANRLMLDNAAITSGPMLEIATSLLSGYDKNNAGAAPWRVYSRNASSPGTPAVRAIELPSRLNELGGLADRFENNADEVSAIPRYMTGENVSQGAAGTASGMSMLMGAANIMIKDLVSSWDEGITRSFIQGMYRWNMQFNKDNSIKGDFDVKARGSSSLVAREVRAQQLDMFSQAVANPMDAPFIKRDKLLRQRAEAHELTDVVKTEDEVAAEQNNQMAQQQQQMAMQQAQLAMSELGQKVALLTAQVAKATAEAELTRAKTVDTKVASAFSALQAGGVATSTPQIAPAGDEILRSAGWTDATPDPSMAQLGGPPVQAEPVQMPPMQGPHEGMQTGIETPRIE